MNQLTLKREGMIQAASADRFHLERARRTAHKIGLLRGLCSIDDVRRECPDLPVGNYMGSVFKDGYWEFESYMKADHEGSHARVITVWKYTKSLPVQNPAHRPNQSRVENISSTQGVFNGVQQDLFTGFHSPNFRASIGI